MSVTLEKEKVITNRAICQKHSRTSVECDVIVPDINPDILKVLEVSGYVSVSEKEIKDGKVFIGGKVHMTVLYTPEGETVNKVKSLSAEREFKHTVDANGATEDMILYSEVVPEEFNYSVINSRKLNLRCIVGIGIKVATNDEYDAVCDIDDDCVCVKTETMRLCNGTVSTEGRISVKEDFELPSNLPGANEILRVTVFPEAQELTLTENKATAKGQARICVLYSSADDGCVKRAEFTSPFCETFDMNGAEEDMEGEIEYSPTDLFYEIREDSDGEPRIFGIDIGMTAQIRGYRICDMDIISDVYSTNAEITPVAENIRIEELVDNITARITHKEAVNIPDGMPEPAQIYDVNAVATVDGVEASDGEIIIHGTVKNDILYMSEDNNAPICTFKANEEFTHTLASPVLTAESICDAKIYPEHISYTMNGPDSVDIRVVLGICVRAYKEKDVPIISDLEISECESDKRKPCITVYFAREGDTLWKIAKHYKTTVDDLKEYNDLKDDMINIGQQIKIC